MGELPEYSACGVGFVANLHNTPDSFSLERGLKALVNLEHRGGVGPDRLTGDGSGIMTDIPHALLGVGKNDAVASLFLPRDPTTRLRSLGIFEATFKSLGLEVYSYREVPVDPSVLSESQKKSRPEVLMAFIRRPEHCSSRYAFEKILYAAKQLTRSRLREAGIIKQFFFTSLSAGTLVYKALTTSENLPKYFLDLRNPEYRTRFSLFHRRFSTNTATAWDTAQPFRVVAHNGEINTISGNRAWAYARERTLGLRKDELLTHRDISDSGSVNEMIEALLFRSSIPHPEDILAILMPQAGDTHSFYRFWSRAMEPWDGPALFAYSDGRTIGARLDRSGFRPCRWSRTRDHFFLSSEAGSFEIEENEILEKGSLSGGGSVHLHLGSGNFHFKDASHARENFHASFDPRLKFLERLPLPEDYRFQLEQLSLFQYTEEEIKNVISPMIRDGKEGIGSMGDTARLPVFSEETRSVFDYFYQNFAQVTNPPLDYLREKIVTDMRVNLGRRPNILEPKELLPLKIAVDLPGPVLTLGQLEFLKGLEAENGFEGEWPASATFDTTFDRARGVEGIRERIREIQEAAAKAVHNRKSIFILSDRNATTERPPIPAILILSALNHRLNDGGTRLRAAIVVDSGEIKSPHHVAVLVGFGAAAVCPYLPLEMAHKFESNGDAQEREYRVVRTLEMGLLKIMSKMGVSVVRSYQSAELFTIVGLGRDIHQHFFPNHASSVGGLSLESLIERWLRNTSKAPLTTARAGSGLIHNYLYKEHPREPVGERHSMTIARSKLIHKLVLNSKTPLSSPELYDAYLKSTEETEPISFRHLLRPVASVSPVELDSVEPREEIFRTFGAGAMSFGAISAESQRDIILAMREIGGRSNSGEGGENPYSTEGISASIKQVASGRFGVTAEYLASGKEIQIKICQGAKPGEGGQLMAVKVNAEIARARHSDENVDLISPPPMHDIYSIEDLKQLIYEFKQLRSETDVSVKLASGSNIGTIAVGVVKAGADVIHIAGHDGGTGAAPLSSMKHAGLPWELGLVEVHQTLLAQNLRHVVRLRVDGGLSTGRDIVTAALLGAEEFDFGKLLLVAEGCIMARVCEKNTCPTGIATHNPKFKALYRGNKDRIVSLLTYLAEDVRRHLARLGKSRLKEIVGRADLLEIHPAHETRVKELGLDLNYFLRSEYNLLERSENPFTETTSPLNERIVRDFIDDKTMAYAIRPTDRALLATLNGKIAARDPSLPGSLANREIRFTGSAGQGFCVFLQPELSVRLEGEANDSVAKSMSGGLLTVVPSPHAAFDPIANTLIGNCALYGATGGKLFVHGLAANRFAVRNSGATAVVEGVGMHACEYMTRGTVVILGRAGANIGAGMTGGTLFLSEEASRSINSDYVHVELWNENDDEFLRVLLAEYCLLTGSRTAKRLLENWGERRSELVKCVPIRRSQPIVEEISRPAPPAFLASSILKKEEGATPFLSH